MILLGRSVRRTRPLPRWNGAPLLLGALVLAWAILGAGRTVEGLGLDSASNIWLQILQQLFPTVLMSGQADIDLLRFLLLLVAAGTWVALGYGLWLVRQSEPAPALPAGEVQGVGSH
jgi:hypothetical protein